MYWQISSTNRVLVNKRRCRFLSMAGIMNTQNQLWANDKSKFGYRMLQKMGWSEGKGLGVNEDGVKEHVRVRKKLSNGGIGAEKDPTDAWKVPAQVACGFNDVLTRLSTSHPHSRSVSPDCGSATNEDNEKTDEKLTSTTKDKHKRSFFSRRAAQKNVRRYSQAELREIFGGAPLGNTAQRSDINNKPLTESATEVDVVPDESNTKTVKRDKRRKSEKKSKQSVKRTITKKRKR